MPFSTPSRTVTRVQHERQTRAKGILINRDADGILERGNVTVGAYLGHSGPKTKVEIGRYRIIIDGVQLKDLADALIDTAEQLEDDLRFYGGAA